MDDESLVARARSGDLGAAHDLLARYQGLAYGTALRLLAEPAEAEDVTQEALLQAYTHLADLREDAGFGPWLRRIAVNKSLNVLRRRGRLRFESLAGEAEGPDEADREFVDERQPTPEDEVLDAERLAEVTALLARLPDDQRVALLLRDGYDYDMEEIATLQGCGLSAAKMRVSRGRKALRALLAGTGGPEGIEAREMAQRAGGKR